MAKPIAIVNDSDEVIGSATKEEAWAKGLLHRVVRVMIENDRGEVLLQKRAPDKDIFPDCWDNSVAGHVDANEDYDRAARREADEEIGEPDLLLKPNGMYRSDETINGKRFCF